MATKRKKRNKNNEQTHREENRFHLELLKQMLQLATAGFGLVAALAWNQAVQTFIEEYIKPYIPSGSGMTSQLIYAAVITLLAVTITYQLTKITQRFEKKK